MEGTLFGHPHEKDIPVREDGTVKIHAEEGDAVYFVGYNGLYPDSNFFEYLNNNRLSSEKTFIETSIGGTGVYDAYLIYSGGPFVIGSSEKLELKRVTARIDLEIHENNSNIRVTQIDFFDVHYHYTRLFPDLYFSGSTSSTGSSGGSTLRKDYHDKPLSAGLVENIQSLYRHTGSPKQKVAIHLLYGDKEEEMLVTAELPDILNNHIYKLSIKDVGTNVTSTIKEIEGAWKEGEAARP